MLKFRLLFWLVLCALGLGACSGQGTLFTVVLTGLPEETVRVDLAVQLNSQPLGRSQNLLRSEFQDRVEVLVAAAIESPAALQVSARDAAGCLLARQSVTLDPAVREVTVSLGNALREGCVHVVQSGEGTVTISKKGFAQPLLWTEQVPPRYELRRGAVEQFKADDRLVLQAEGTGQSYFAGWGGACRGTEPCEVTVGPEPLVIYATFAPRRSCTASGFCWLNPTPTGFTLRAAFGFSARDVWAAGEGGSVLRFNGEAWAPLLGPSSATLNGIWGSQPNDVWFVGDGGTIWRWNGDRFERSISQAEPITEALYAVWGSAPDDVWIAGQQGLLLRCRADLVCSRIPTDHVLSAPAPDLRAAWGFSAQEIYFAGSRGSLLRWDGAQLVREEMPAPSALTSLWGKPSRRGGNELFIGSRSGALYRKDAQGIVLAATVPMGIEALAGRSHPTAEDPVWFAGTSGLSGYYDKGPSASGGQPPELIGTGVTSSLNGAWVAPGGEAFITGKAGVLLRWNGAQFIRYGGGRTGRVVPSGRWGDGQGNLWVTLDTRSVLQVADSGSSGYFAGTNGLWGLFGFAERPTTLHGSGDLSGLWRQVDDRWEPFFFLGNPAGQILTSAWGTSRDDLWVSGTRLTIARFNSGRQLFGFSLQQMIEDTLKTTFANPLFLYQIFGTSADNVFAVGDLGLVLWTDGRNVDFRSPFALSRSSPTLTGVWAGSAQDVWIVGEQATVRHWDGTAWQKPDLPCVDPNMLFTGISGRTSDDVWIVGAPSNRPSPCPAAYHWDGTSFSAQANTPARLGSVWTDDAGVFLIGEDGEILFKKRSEK